MKWRIELDIEQVNEVYDLEYHRLSCTSSLKAGI